MAITSVLMKIPSRMVEDRMEYEAIAEETLGKLKDLFAIYLKKDDPVKTGPSQPKPLTI